MRFVLHVHPTWPKIIDYFGSAGFSGCDRGDKGDPEAKCAFRVGPRGRQRVTGVRRRYEAVTPVTPTCHPQIQESSSWSPLSHRSPARGDGCRLKSTICLAGAPSNFLGRSPRRIWHPARSTSTEEERRLAREKEEAEFRAAFRPHAVIQTER